MMKPIVVPLTLLAVCSLVCVIACDVRSGEVPQGSVDLPGARIVAAAFAGDEVAERFTGGSSSVRRDAPPFTPVYAFRWASGLTDPEGVSLTGVIYVEQSTGRVLRYDPGLGYKDARNAGKAKPADSEVVAESAIRDLGNAILTKANVMDGMRLKSIKLERFTPADPLSTYVLVFARYRDVANVGEVELPALAGLEVDAVTREVYMFSFKEWPVDIQLVPPGISKGSAIATLKAKQILDEPVEVLDAHLSVTFNLDRLSREEQKLKDTDLPKFWSEVGAKRQVLAWEIKAKGVRPQSGKSVEFSAFVDALTGTVFGAVVPL